MEEKYIEDIKEIKDIMNRSTRFISLSGLSGISTGIIALVGVYGAYSLVFKDQEYLVHQIVEIAEGDAYQLLLIALATLILSVSSALVFTRRKTKQQNSNVWDDSSKRLLVNLLIPLVTGGLFCLLLLLQGFIGLLAPVSLIFYGLALVNGSKYSLVEIRNLGIIQIVLGLLAFQFINYSLILWALGFGLVQIIYGLMVQKKYSQ